MLFNPQQRANEEKQQKLLDKPPKEKMKSNHQTVSHFHKSAYKYRLRNRRRQML